MNFSNYSYNKIDIHNQIELAYIDVGRGKNTLLFIHGLANYAAAWKYQLAYYSYDYRCIALDLPGNGFSSTADYPYSMFFYAESVKFLIDKLNLDNVILCGHSMGAQISLILALRYPHLVEKLILIAPAGIERFSPTDRLWMQTLLNIGDFLYSDEMHLESAIRDSFTQSTQDMMQMIEDLKQLMHNRTLAQWRKMVVQSIHGMLNEQTQQFLPHITQPALVLLGASDKLIPNRILHPTLTVSKLAKECEALLQNATVKIIPDAGHFMQVEQFAKINQFIDEWI